MHVLWFEFMLSLRRLLRRRVQSGLMLATFTVSITLSLLSWSLFYTIFLRNPDFDRKGELYLLSYVGAAPGSGWKRSLRVDLDAWKAQQTVFADFTGMALYRSSIITSKGGAERVLGANLSSESLRMVGAQPFLGRMFTAEEDKFGCAPVVMRTVFPGAIPSRRPSDMTIALPWPNPTTCPGTTPRWPRQRFSAHSVFYL